MRQTIQNYLTLSLQERIASLKAAVSQWDKQKLLRLYNELRGFYDNLSPMEKRMVHGLYEKLTGTGCGCGCKGKSGGCGDKTPPPQPGVGGCLPCMGVGDGNTNTANEGARSTDSKKGDWKDHVMPIVVTTLFVGGVLIGLSESNRRRRGYGGL